MKIIKNIVLVAVALATACGIFLASGCGLFESKEKHKRVKVSTIEEMRKVGSKNIAVLTDDIDCDFAVIQKISGLYGIDGGGHTLKNIVLNGNAVFDCDKIENLTIEGVTYKAENITDAAIVAYRGSNYNGEEIEINNVHVKNSQMVVNAGRYVGVFVGSGFKTLNQTSIKLSNCSIDEVTVDCYGNENDWTGELYVGGFVGYSKNASISGCTANGCDLNVNPKKTRNCAVGGIIGYNYPSGGIVGSCNTDSYISVEAYHYSMLMGMAINHTTTVYAGGIAGFFNAGGSISCCYAEEAHISAGTIGSVNAGGIAGYISGRSQDYISHDYDTKIAESYVVESYISTHYSDPHKSPHYIGGLVGSSVNTSFVSSFVCNTKIGLNMNDTSDYSFISGLIGKPSNSDVVNYCATGMNEILIDSNNGQVSSETVDDFMPSGKTSYCYVTEPIAYGNLTNAKTLTETEWYTPAAIAEKLNLISSNWEYETGKLPYLTR